MKSRSLLILSFSILLIALMYGAFVLSGTKTPNPPQRTYTYEEQSARNGDYEETFFLDDGKRVATLRIEFFGSCKSQADIERIGNSLKGKISSWEDVVTIAEPQFKSIMPNTTSEKTEAVFISSPLYGNEKRIQIFENN